MNHLETLVESLKKDLIAQLNLQHLTPEQIDATSPLFGDGLGLDSIDALEIIVMLEKNYGVKIANAEEGRSILKNLQTIAEFIQQKKA